MKFVGSKIFNFVTVITVTEKEACALHKKVCLYYQNELGVRSPYGHSTRKKKQICVKERSDKHILGITISIRLKPPIYLSQAIREAWLFAMFYL